jgi:hypothetical protein
MSALVIHPGALGDVLLAVPALRALRAGGDAVTVAAQPRIGALLVALGVADRAVAFDTLGLDVLFSDAPLAPDAPLARQLAEVTRVVCWFGARDAQFARRLRALAPGVMIAPATTSTTRVWEHLLQTVGGPADRAPVAVAAAHVERGREMLCGAGWDGVSRVLVVHPGAGGASKRWPVEGFAGVVESLDATVVVHQGPADADAVRAFLAHVARPVLRVIDPSLPTLAAALSTATAYVGNDSGISHLAASVGTPSVILFTESARAWLPWSPTATCLTISTAKVVDAERLAIQSALSSLL